MNFRSLPSLWWRFALAWLLLMGAARVGLSGAFDYDAKMKRARGDSPRLDFDTIDFIDNVQANPRFADTFKWWSGPWYPKVPYYRPLTMTLFWAENHAYGPHGRVAFQWTHRLLHLLFLTLLMVFFIHVAGWKRGVLGAVLFASTANRFLLLPVGDDAFNCWKDQCDVLSISLSTLACLLFWRGSRGGSGDWWRQKWWWGALVCMVVGVTVKESGFLLPLYLSITLWAAKRLRALWPALLPFFGVAALLWVYRLWALGGWGNKTGGGHGWPTRFAGQVLGLPTSIIGGDGLPVLALCPFAALALWLTYRAGKWPQKSARTLWLSLALVGVTAGLAAWKTLLFLPESPPFENFARLSLFPVWNDTALFLFMIGGAALSLLLWRRGERAMFFGWLWVFIGFLPLILQPPTSPHVHYPIAPGWSLWLACGALWLFDGARAWLRKRGQADGKSASKTWFEPANRKDAAPETP